MVSTVFFARYLALAFALLMAPMACLAAERAIPPKTDDFAFSDPYFEEVGDVKSIVGGQVTALAQDSKGRLWIGTQNGLLAYDGYRFRRYVHDPKDPASLAGDLVSALWASPDGKLWVGTVGDGVSLFDPQTERFVSTRNDPTNAQTMVGGRVRSLVGDAAGGIWIGTNLGLDYRSPGSNAAAVFHHQMPEGTAAKPLSVYSFVMDRQGGLWVGTADGLLHRAKDRERLVRVASDPANPGSLAGQTVRSLFEAADGKLWLGLNGQDAVWLDTKTGRLNRPDADPLFPKTASLGYIKAIAQPQPDQLWLGSTDASITVVSAEDGRVLRKIRHAPAVSSSLSPSAISALMTDRSGLAWVGTVSGGLLRHQPNNGAVRMVRHSPARPDGLSVSDVHSVLEHANGSIWVGTGGNGIDILDRLRGLVGSHRPALDRHGALTDGTILSLAQMADGSVWAGTHQAGVFRLDPKSATWKSYDSTHGLPPGYVNQLVVARDDTLWAGTGGGVARWLPETQRFERATQLDGTVLDLPVEFMARDGFGRIWAGGRLGLWVKQPGGAGFQAISVVAPQSRSKGATTVEGLLVDRQDQVWVSNAQGLYILKAWVGGSPAFEQVNPLVNRKSGNYGANLLDDEFGRIWSTDILFDPKTNRVTELSSVDGVDLGTSWPGANTRTRDGLLLFGGTRGLAVVDPGRFQPWAYQPGVQASELKINGATVALAALTQGLTLTPEQRNFSIEFASLDFSAPRQNRYGYRLQGYDKDWIATDDEHRNASYGNLWPGQYTLQVRGSNRLGEWSPHELTIPIQVMPAFWQTAWFLGLALMGLGGIAFAGYRWRVARLHAFAAGLQSLVEARTADIAAAHTKLETAHGELEQQARKLQDVNEQRTRFVSMTSHEFRTPLATILSSSELLKHYDARLSSADKIEITTAIETSVGRMTEMLDKVLTIGRAEGGMLEFKPVPLKLRALCEDMVEHARLQWPKTECALVTHFEMEDKDALVDPKLLRHIFDNLLSNAIKYSPSGGTVRFSVHQHAEQAVFEVSDEGIGVPQEDLATLFDSFQRASNVGEIPGTGLGLAIVKSSVDLHGGSITVTSQLGKGTCFTVRIGVALVESWPKRAALMTS